MIVGGVFFIMDKRKAFKFYRSYYEILLELSDTDKVEFLMALLELQFTGRHRELKGMAKFAFISQKHSIDAQIQGYLDKVGGELPPIEPPIKPPSQEEKEKEQVQVQEKEKEKEERARDFEWFKSQIDEIWTDQLPSEKKANLGVAIQNAWEFLSADSLRLKVIDSAGCKRLVSKAFQYDRSNGRAKTPQKKSFNLNDI